MSNGYKLKKGDPVVMHTCMEHDHPDNFARIWVCRSDEFQHKGHDYGSVMLEGFSGSFSTKFLQKVNVEVPDKEVERIRKELEEKERELEQWRSKYEFKRSLLKTTDESRNEVDRMYREALEAAHGFQKELEDMHQVVGTYRKALSDVHNNVRWYGYGTESVLERVKSIVERVLGEEEQKIINISN